MAEDNPRAPRAPIDVAGLSNLRDFGGYPTRSGEMIPHGRLFRSAHLGRLSPAAKTDLGRLGLKTVIDLRGRIERLDNAFEPAGGSGMAVVSAPIEPGSFTSMETEDGTAITAEMNRERILWIYRRFPNEAGKDFGAALEAVLSAADAPFLIHCTAGKDRTGFLAALILTLLDVDPERVMEDYLLTNAHWDQEYSGRAIFPPDVVAPLLAAHETYLGTALDAIRATHGTAQRFADSVTGTRDFAGRLRAKVLAPQP